MRLLKISTVFKLFGLAALASLGFTVFTHTNASAISNVQPEGSNRLIINAAVGAGSFPSAVSYSYLYVPTTYAGNVTVSVNTIANELTGGAGRLSSFSIRNLDSPGGNCSATRAITNAGGTGTIPTNSLAVANNGSVTFSIGGTTYRAFCVRVETAVTVGMSYATACGTVGSTSCYQNVAFRLNTNVGLIGNFSGADNSSGTGYYRSDGWSGDWSQSVDFAPLCGQAPYDHINLFDLDTYAGVNSDLRVRLLGGPKGGALGVLSIITAGTAPNGWTTYAGNYYYPINVPSGGDVRVTPTGGYNNNWRYEVQITGIGQNNKIRIRIPFEQLGGGSTCSPPPAPTVNVTSSCSVAGVLTVTVSATNQTSVSTSTNGPGAGPWSGEGTFTDSSVPRNGVTYTVTSTATGPGGTRQDTSTYNCPTYNDAACVSASITDNAGTYPSNTFRVNVTFRNTGTRTWTRTGSNPYAMGARTGSEANFITDDGSPASYGAGVYDSPAGNVAPGGTATFSFDYQTPDTHGTTHNYYWRMYQSGVQWFGPICGLRFTTVHGIVGDAFSWATHRQIGINSCRGTVNNRLSDGVYNFAIARDSSVVSVSNAFCVRAVVPPALGVDSVWVRPGTTGYLSCAANTYCYQSGPPVYQVGSYECQAVGVNNGVQTCGGTSADWDRSQDTHYSIALGWRPEVTCSVTSITAPVGIPYTPQVTTQNENIANGTTVSIITNANGISHTVAGQTSYGTLSPAVAEGGSQAENLSPQAIIPSAQAFTPDASVAWRGPTSPANPYSGTADCDTDGTYRAVYNPYFKVYSGDIRVGGGFNSGYTACSAAAQGQGRVAAWAANMTWPSGPAGYRGASAEFALIARGVVSGGGLAGFYSGETNVAMTPTYKALTFANDAASGTYGGSFGATRCMPDYYTITQEPDPGSLGAGSHTWATVLAARNPGTGQVVINGNWNQSGGDLNVSGRTTVYVNGDVYITGNVRFPAGDYANEAAIPFFALVVRGNIMIAPGVTQLDGVYIAQPDGASGGGVYTCAVSLASLCPTSTLYAQGANKLTFNGFVIAKLIKLLRTNGHLVNGTATEDAGSANIAEVFNGDPSIYMANPAFRLNLTDTGLYDSATSLPPLL